MPETPADPPPAARLAAPEQRFVLLATTRHVLWLAVALGAALAAVGAATWMRASSAAVTLALLALHLYTRRRRPVLILDAAGYRVEAAGALRFRVAWSAVRRVLCDASEQALYVETDDRRHNLLLPPARGYAFTFSDREKLYAAVRAAVPDKLEEVERLGVGAAGKLEAPKS